MTGLACAQTPYACSRRPPYRCRHPCRLCRGDLWPSSMPALLGITIAGTRSGRPSPTSSRNRVERRSCVGRSNSRDGKLTRAVAVTAAVSLFATSPPRCRARHWSCSRTTGARLPRALLQLQWLVARRLRACSCSRATLPSCSPSSHSDTPISLSPLSRCGWQKQRRARQRRR